MDALELVDAVPISYDWEAIDCCDIVALLINTSILRNRLIVPSIRDTLTSSLEVSPVKYEIQLL
jgi:hypothetical protein